MSKLTAALGPSFGALYEIPATAKFLAIPALLLSQPWIPIPAWGAFGISLAFAYLLYGGKGSGHVNPVVTLVMACGGKIPFSAVPAYWICQVLGAVIGIYSASFLLTGKFSTYAATLILAQPEDPTKMWDVFKSEAVGPFWLVMVIFAAASQPALKIAGSLPVGVTLAGLAYFLGPVSGASFNPTPALVTYFMSKPENGWGDYAFAYGLGPFAGVALLCAFVLVMRLAEEPS